MALLRMWAGLELRRRWRALLMLTLLVAVAAGTVLAGVAGARRAASVLERLEARTLPTTVLVLPNQPGFDWAAVRALPGVAALAEFAVTMYGIDGVPDQSACGFPIAQPVMDTVERPVVLAGRLPDPARADEAIVTPGFVQRHGLGVGDRVGLRLFTPEQIDATYGTQIVPEPEGPVLDTTIVGVVRSFWFSDTPGGPGMFGPSPGLLAQYRSNLLGAREVASVNAMVRLTDGAAGIPAFQAELARLTGQSDIAVIDQTAAAAAAQRTIDFEAGCLLAFALAALAAAAVLVGQTISRFASAAAADLGVLRAVGMRRQEALGAAAAAPVLAVVLGGLAGTGLAMAASPWFPVGSAALLEPAPGFAFDPLVHVGGAALLAGLAAVATVGAAARALATPGQAAAARRSAVATAAAAIGLPVPVVIGVRFALEPGRGSTALPVRPALLGAVTGVLGVVAALTFSAGVSDAAGNPARFGQTQDLEMFIGQGGTDFVDRPDALLAALAADPDVDAVLDARLAVIDLGGTPVSAFTYAPVAGARFPVVLRSGRLPATADEIVLAPTTAAQLGATTGSAVPGPGGPLTVTGIGFVPYAGHNNYDSGAWLDPAGYDRLTTGFKFRTVMISLTPGADPAAAAERLSAVAGAAAGTGSYPVTPPAELVEAALLRNVELLPLLLGAFLALLAAGAVGHALATAVRRRRHDVAVLRALGMTRWQARWLVTTQATVLAVVGLVFGMPLGIALGRTLWRFIAEITPLEYQPPVAVLALLLVGPVALLVANALAAWPGRQVARLRIGHVLRAE